MALELVNSTTQCPFRVQVYHDEVPACDRGHLQSILDPAEARQVRLDIKTFKNCICDIMENRDGNDRLTAISFSKTDNQPVALATFKRNGYNSNFVISLPGQCIRSDVVQVTRKLLWELQYVVRRSNLRCYGLGDMVLSCGLEKLGQLSTVTTNVWLIVSNSFLNSSAIRLYLSYGFQMSGLYQSTLMMILSDLDERKIERAVALVKRQVECMFLLPDLKNRVVQPVHDTPSSSRALQTASSGQETVDAASDISVSSHASSSSHTSNTSIAPKAKRQRSNGDLEGLKGTNDDDNDSLVSLDFTSFSEHVKWAPSLITPIDGEMNEMVRHTATMYANVEAIDEKQSFLQHLEIAKQIEIFSKRINKNSYDAIYDLQNGLGLSIQYLRAILRVSWAVYRFPILEQCRIQWRVSITQIPRIASILDRIAERNGSFPRNITAAQEDRHSLYVRLSLQYPEHPLGDGDGLPYTSVLSVHGLFRNDTPLETNSESYENTSWYRRIRASVATEVRSRIIGYDTQEVPRPSDEKDSDTPQPFWQEGKRFLLEQLQGLLGDVQPHEAVLLVDCFSVDLYDRLLIDIRGIYHSGQLANPPPPNLNRFELAHRALSSGFAFPTYNFFVNERLLAAFDGARERQRGAFGSAGPVYHPSVCRRRRYEIFKNVTRARRRRYDE